MRVILSIALNIVLFFVPVVIRALKALHEKLKAKKYRKEIDDIVNEIKGRY